MAHEILTAARLREVLHYDPETGVFTWLVRRRPRTKVGDVAGGFSESAGAVIIGINNRHRRGHRLAWLYMYGVWPQEQIDHIDGNPANNRLCNLREADQSLNMQNLHRATKRNKAGLLGVYRDKRSGTYRAQIWFNGKTHYLGYFLTPELAHAAYLTAKREYHPGCTL